LSSRFGQLYRIIPALIVCILVGFYVSERIVLVSGVSPHWLGVSLDSVSALSTIFLGIFVEGVPFLLLGTLASGLIEVFISSGNLARFIPNHPVGAALVGSMMGLFFPVCECGVIPLARRLLKKGVALPAGIAFLLSAPVINPIVMASTWTAFGFGKIFWGRILVTLMIAVIIAVLFSLISDPAQMLSSEKSDIYLHDIRLEGTTNIRPDGNQGRFSRAMGIASDEFFEMGRFLVLGAFLSALMQTFLPQQILLEVGKGPLMSVLVMSILAALLSIGSSVDAFAALSYSGVFMGGGILAFLVFGPMVDIKSTLMYLAVFKKRIVAYLILLSFLMTMITAVGLNYFAGW